MHPTLSLAVVGITHPNKKGPTRAFAIQLCRPGDPVELVPEPKNPVDPRAVMVLNRGMMMGYVTAERCGMVKRQLEEGGDVRAIFQAQTAYGAIVRVTFDGSEPVLPPVSHASETTDDEDDGFYPDEEWPDE